MTSNVNYPETLRLIRKYSSREGEPLGQVFTRVAQALEAATGASVTEEQARDYVRKERERNANRDKPIPRDGFLNDYD